MSPRASWKGSVKVHAASFAAALYPAVTASAGISLHGINSQTGNRLKCDWIDSVSGQSVAKENRAKGYDIGNGQCLKIEDHELAAIKTEDTKTIEIKKFVPSSDLDFRYFDATYYLAAADHPAAQSLAELRATLQRSKLVAFGQGTLFGRARWLFIQPFQAGLACVILRASHEVRDLQDQFDAPKADVASKASHDLLRTVRSMSGRLASDELTDDYQSALLELIRSKLKPKTAQGIRSGDRSSPKHLATKVRQSSRRRAREFSI